jgi:hypothetical protein
MSGKKIVVSTAIVVIVLSLLAGCGKATPTVDPSAKITEIASTVQAELTSIALLTPSSTATPEPTITPIQTMVTPTLSSSPATATPTKALITPISGDNAKWLADVTIPDYSLVAPSSNFVKTWNIQNTGTTTWTKDYKLIYLEGLQGTNNTVTINLTKEVAPGESVDVSVPFTAPATNGTYSSAWKMYTATGYVFGEVLFMYINVGTSTMTPTISPTP